MKQMSFHRFAQAIYHFEGGCFVRLWHEQGKFLSAQAAKNVKTPNVFKDQFGETRQGSIASQVTKVIIDPFEIIKIK